MVCAQRERVQGQRGVRGARLRARLRARGARAAQPPVLGEQRSRDAPKMSKIVAWAALGVTTRSVVFMGLVVNFLACESARSA